MIPTRNVPMMEISANHLIFSNKLNSPLKRESFLFGRNGRMIGEGIQITGLDFQYF